MKKLLKLSLLFDAKLQILLIIDKIGAKIQKLVLTEGLILQFVLLQPDGAMEHEPRSILALILEVNSITQNV